MYKFYWLLVVAVFGPVAFFCEYFRILNVRISFITRVTLEVTAAPGGGGGGYSRMMRSFEVKLINYIIGGHNILKNYSHKICPVRNKALLNT